MDRLDILGIDIDEARYVLLLLIAVLENLKQKIE